MKKLAIVIIPLILLAIAVSAYTPAIQADNDKYSVKNLKGDYAFSAAGMMYPNFPDLSSASWVCR